MAERYSFFNAVADSSGNFDREYMAEDFARYFASFIGNGVYAYITNCLKVTPSSGMTVQVAAGKAWINGYFYENTAVKTFDIDVSTSGNSRKDWIVLRLDLSKRLIELAYKKGASNSIPALTRTDTIYELGLAYIQVTGNKVSISSGDISDTRANTKYCGQVAALVEKLDTAGLFTQYDKAFNDWFNEIKDTLDGDTAGNLLNQIQQLSLITTAQNLAMQQLNSKADDIAANKQDKATLHDDMLAASTGDYKWFYYSPDDTVLHGTRYYYSIKDGNWSNIKFTNSKGIYIVHYNMTLRVKCDGTGGFITTRLAKNDGTAVKDSRRFSHDTVAVPSVNETVTMEVGQTFILYNLDNSESASDGAFKWIPQIYSTHGLYVDRATLQMVQIGARK